MLLQKQQSLCEAKHNKNTAENTQNKKRLTPLGECAFNDLQRSKNFSLPQDFNWIWPAGPHTCNHLLAIWPAGPRAARKNGKPYFNFPYLACRPKKTKLSYAAKAPPQIPAEQLYLLAAWDLETVSLPVDNILEQHLGETI